MKYANQGVPEVPSKPHLKVFIYVSRARYVPSLVPLSSIVTIIASGLAKRLHYQADITRHKWIGQRDNRKMGKVGQEESYRVLPPGAILLGEVIALRRTGSTP